MRGKMGWVLGGEGALQQWGYSKSHRHSQGESIDLSGSRYLGRCVNRSNLEGKCGRPLGGTGFSFGVVDATGLGRKRSNRGHQQGRRAVDCWVPAYIAKGTCVRLAANQV